MDFIAEDFEKTFKVVVIGDGRSGKSSMIKRYCEGVFNADYKKTIGVNFLEKTCYYERDDQDVTLHIWDTAGQEEFSSLTQHYYRGSSACIIVCSLDNYDSFEHILEWKEKVLEEVGQIPICFAINKMDLIGTEEAQFTLEDVENRFYMMKMKHFECSVKDDSGVTDIFDYLVEKCMNPQKHVENTVELTFDHEEHSKPVTRTRTVSKREAPLTANREITLMHQQDQDDTSKSFWEGFCALL
ncbi:hypothetical protein PCE1_001619 [Barthelona sp. PCE]